MSDKLSPGAEELIAACKDMCIYRHGADENWAEYFTSVILADAEEDPLLDMHLCILAISIRKGMQVHKNESATEN